VHTVGFGSGFPDLSIDHNYTFFGVQSRGLRPRFPSASDTASQRSPFGSAIDLLARLGSSGIYTRWAILTIFKGVTLFHHPEFTSARAPAVFGKVLISSLSQSMSRRNSVHRRPRKPALLPKEQ
jgi:hypothetical protein